MIDLRSGRAAGGSWVLSMITLVLMAVGLWGCGAAGAYEAKSAGAAMGPGSAAPAEPASADEASGDTLYRESAAKELPERGGLAQATPPAPAMKKDSATEAVPDAATAGKNQPGVATGANGKAVAGPLLIYKAQLYMAVFETRKAIDAVEKLAKESGGYLVSREDARITVRVPARRFDGALEEVTKLGDLLHRNVNVQDVTAEYTDLAIRLRNLEVMRDRLEELLKKAAKVEEALAVERELERVAGDIERHKGRLKLLQELVTFSTITVEFQPRPVDHVDSKVQLPFPWLDRLGLGELLRL
ncbi:MAG: DUF4349 domain-containing protein [Myxococcales bacterium]|nr:DUF4349 domain-containing protein [Myxococcales bacterium]